MVVNPERQEILELVGDALHEGSLPPAKEYRLRTLLEHHIRTAPTLSWNELVKAGLFTLGVWVTFEPESLGVEG